MAYFSEICAWPMAAVPLVWTVPLLCLSAYSPPQPIGFWRSTPFAASLILLVFFLGEISFHVIPFCLENMPLDLFQGGAPVPQYGQITPLCTHSTQLAEQGLPVRPLSLSQALDPLVPITRTHRPGVLSGSLETTPHSD